MRLREVIPVCVVGALVGAVGSGAVATSGSRSSPGALVVTKGHTVKQVAGDGKRLVWETGPLEGDNTETTLFVRPLGKRGHVLVRNVKSTYGLALAAGWVVYANGGAHTRLSAIRADGSRRIVLSRWLAAPFVTRGRLLAWIEQDGRRQKVVVRDMKTGRVRLVATPPHCQQGHCYRLEQVTLGDGGVIFTRDSTKPDLSWVVRIRFSNRVVTRVRLSGDPQPNLVPSSAGAVYYVFGHGWYRWDFGGQPHGTPFRANPPAPLLSYERGRWLLLTRSGCDSGVAVLDPDGHRRVIVTPRRLKRLVPPGERRCVFLQASAWVGSRPLTAWAVIPRKSSEEHEDAGLYGVVFVGSRQS